MFSTANIYRLPTYYNYGVGSYGFGVFREIVAHIKTTNWVLDGSIEYFPLLYHWRIVPRARSNNPIDEDRHKEHIRYWNSSKRIDQFIRDWAAAQYEAILFLEHIPHTKNERAFFKKNTYYEKVLGFEEAEWGGTFTAVARDGWGIYLCQGGQGQPRTWVWVGAYDVDALYEEFVAKGAKIALPPTNYPHALEMRIEEPDGHVLRFGSGPREYEPFEQMQ